MTVRVAQYGETLGMNHQKPKTQTKMETTRPYGETRCVICQNGWKILESCCQMRKQQWTKIGKTRENTGMAADERQKQERGDRWSKDRRQESSFCFLDGSLSSQEFGVGTQLSEIQRPRCTPRWHWKTIRALMQFFTEHGSSPSQMTAAKVMVVIAGCAGQAADAVSAYTQVKKEDAPSLLKKKKNKVRMSRYLDTSTKTQMAEIMVQHGRPSRSSWAKSVRSSFGRTIMWMAIQEKFYWNTAWKKVPNWDCLLVNPEKGLFFSVYVDDIKLAGEKHCPNVECTYERSRFGRTNIVPWSLLFGVALNETAKRAKILWTITETCLNPGSLQEPKKSFLVQWNLTHTSLHGPMICKIMQKCVERYCELANKTTIQL